MVFDKWYWINGVWWIVFDKVYLIKSISAVTNYNEILVFWGGQKNSGFGFLPLYLNIILDYYFFWIGSLLRSTMCLKLTPNMINSLIQYYLYMKTRCSSENKHSCSREWSFSFCEFKSKLQDTRLYFIFTRNLVK